jgi:hypothetical protein
LARNKFSAALQPTRRRVHLVQRHVRATAERDAELRSGDRLLDALADAEIDCIRLPCRERLAIAQYANHEGTASLGDVDDHRV